MVKILHLLMSFLVPLELSSLGLLNGTKFTNNSAFVRCKSPVEILEFKTLTINLWWNKALLPVILKHLRRSYNESFNGIKMNINERKNW